MSRNRRGRLRGDGGAVLVEFALVAPFIVSAVLGILEFGIAWRDANVLERSVAAGGRTGATWADNGQVDYLILKNIESMMASSTSLEIEKVVVFKANASSTVPASCVAVTPPGGVNGLCNVYSKSQVESQDPVAGFGVAGSPVSCGGGHWDRFWCPSGSPTGPRNRDRPGGDYIGIWIRASYEPVTGLIPGTATFERTAVFHIDPETSR